MPRSILQRLRSDDDAIHASAARTRARVLALLHGALRLARIDKVTLAERLGVRKAAVNDVFHGNGNLRIDTLSRYLGALGFEVDLAVVRLGEIDLAREGRRAPRIVRVTLSDEDRVRDDETGAIAIRTKHRDHLILDAWHTHGVEAHKSIRHGEREQDFVATIAARQ